MPFLVLRGTRLKLAMMDDVYGHTYCRLPALRQDPWTSRFIPWCEADSVGPVCRCFYSTRPQAGRLIPIVGVRSTKISVPFLQTMLG